MCVGGQTETLKLLKLLVKYSTVRGRVGRGWSLEGIQRDCHQFPCCQRASAVSLVHPVPMGKVGLPLLPQMTMLTEVPDNAKGNGFACDVDSQLLLPDLMLLVVCHLKTLRYLKRSMASNFCTIDDKQRKIWMHTISYLYFCFNYGLMMHIFQGIFSVMLTGVKHSQPEVLQSIIRIKINVWRMTMFGFIYCNSCG